MWSFPTLVNSTLKGQAAPPPLFELDTTEARLEFRRRLAFHPRGLLYATCGDGVLFEWDLTSEDPAATERHHRLHSNGYSLPDVAVSPDGRLLAVARHGWDGEPKEGSVQKYNMVLVYDVGEPGDPVPLEALPADFNIDGRLAFSADSRWLAANGAGDKGASVWDLEASDVAASRVTSPVGARRNVSGLAFSPDLSWLGFSASDGRIHLWDWRTSKNPLSIATGSGKAAVFWSTNTMLAAGGASGAVELWETLPEKLQEMARQSAGRTLTTEEKARFGLTR
ncbi:MAG: WD40 repeat domain-containing protein [Verrucomicrobiae bacterium]|nr:WD40 repeat domain-containing protein [Verrucomicrobiae bacterium]